MPDKSHHRLSFSLPAGMFDSMPKYLTDFMFRSLMFNAPGTESCSVSGRAVAKPLTIEVLDYMIKQKVQLASERWGFEFTPNYDSACAFQIQISETADRKHITFENDENDFNHLGSLKPDCNANLSKRPQGRFSIVFDTLLVSEQCIDDFTFQSSASVTVRGKTIAWRVVQPETSDFLNRDLGYASSFDGTWGGHLASIAKPDTNLDFGMFQDQGLGNHSHRPVFLLNQSAAKQLFPPNKFTLGDAKLFPVYGHDSPEAELMLAVTTKIKTLVSQSFPNQSYCDTENGDLES